MCDLSADFILCSCGDGEIELDEPHWILHRIDDPTDLRLRIKGKLGRIVLHRDEQQTRENVREELNRRQCFDFEYTPRSGDRLTIKLKKDNGERLSLKYKYFEAWEAMLMNDFASVEELLVLHARGRIDRTNNEESKW